MPPVAGMLLPRDNAIAHDAIEHNRDARFADQQLLHQRGLVHPPLVSSKQVQDIELRTGKAKGLKESLAAALHQALQIEQGDEEIVGFGLAFHPGSITLNCMMSNDITPEAGFHVYPIRGLAGTFHLLHDEARHEAVLIDTGLVGELLRLKRTLGEIGLAWSDIKAILLTHGHLDHTGNVARLKELTGAPVLAHPAEQRHIDGTFPYTGPSRLCGVMEAAGRWAFRYRGVPIDRALTPDEELPWWGGLRVIHLPGHSDGHCGFYSARFDLLFSGDLFASYWFSTHRPPFILNSCPEKFPASFYQVAKLNPRAILPNHYSGLDGERHRRNFDSLAAHHGAK